MATDLLSAPGVDPNPVINETPQIHLRGKVQRIVFQNEEDGYYIFSILRTGTKELAKVKGYGFNLAVGQEVECHGEWEASKNPRYPDPTLKATSIYESVPASEEGIRKLLYSGFIKGVGKTTADTLLAHFGAKLFDVAENNPDALYAVRGVGAARITNLVNGVLEKKAVPRLMAYLAEIGLGPGLSHRVFKKLGKSAVERIKHNPYVLASVPMIGFAKADGVARTIGIEFDSSTRIVAGMEAALLKEAENGSTAVELDRLYQLMDRLLVVDDKAVDPEKIQQIVQQELHDMDRVILRDLTHGPAVSLKEFVRLEKSIAFHIARIVTNYRGNELLAVDSESSHFAHLEPDQIEAARTALGSGFAVMTGRPGCGKTTTAKAIADVITAAKLRLRQSAPTGRAAKRMTEATGYLAVTNHRLLESRGTSFQRNDANPLECDHLLSDEVSMTDTYMAEHTLRAVPDGAGVLLIGDVDQLSSIGAGAFLSDVIKSGWVPVSVLTEIRRQAGDSSIITNAHKIIEGVAPDGIVAPGKKDDFSLISCTDEDKQVEAVLNEFRRLLSKGFAPEDIQVLTPMRQRTALSTSNLNRVLKDMLNPAEGKNSLTIGKFENAVVFSEGDRVMMTANNNDLGVFNGDIGYIMEIDTANKTALIDFNGELVELGRDDMNDLDMAYATTVHKSQGSEFPAVIVPMCKGHNLMWDRNLLYTGITRARRHASTVGDIYLLKSIVKKTNAAKRLTGLKEEINEMFEALHHRSNVRSTRRVPNTGF
jgi:exodeoxyribonuclease V alpha subunit